MKTIIQHSVVILGLAALLVVGCGRKTQSGESQSATNQATQALEYYTCPMHPSVRSDKPGACPICHMSLVKVSATQEHNDSSQERGSVLLWTADQIRANVSTTIVETKTLVKEIAAVGKIEQAESSTKQITSRFPGRIERLFVLCCGQRVGQGDPVAEIYSPDAISAQREFLVALNSPADSSGESALLKQTRLKLKLWGFTDRQLDELSKTQTIAASVIIYSPIAGTVLKKNIDLQQYISTGESLFDVVDLQSVWFQIDIYESDLSAVHVGQAVEASLDASPSKSIKGTVSLVSPILDPVTRTARVRVILDNASGNLRPEMYAHATIFVPLAKSLVVPASAVISNGRMDIVWIEREPGRFEPVQVVLGERSGEFYQVLAGLHEGETVASRGAYLIDSESQLRKATSGGVSK